jgi:hypothetical protein
MPIAEENPGIEKRPRAGFGIQLRTLKDTVFQARSTNLFTASTAESAVGIE